MGEIMIILVVALLVLGPARLPDVANGLGKAIREFRKATKDIQSNLEADETVAKPMQDLRVALHGDPSLPMPTPAPVGTVSVAPAASPPPVAARVDDPQGTAASSAAAPLSASDKA